MKINEYVEKWNISSEYNLNEGIYEWAFELLKPYEKVLEIGCGTGQETITLLRKDHIVFAIDNKEECINLCKDKIENEDFSVEEINCTDEIKFTESEATVMKCSFTDECARRLGYLNPDVIVLCNPGGWVTSNTSTENHFSKLWKLIDLVIQYAELKKIPFMIMNRFSTKEDVALFWQDVENSTEYKLVKKDTKCIHIDKEHDGIRLYDNGKEVYDIIYATGLFVN